MVSEFEIELLADCDEDIYPYIWALKMHKLDLKKMSSFRKRQHYEFFKKLLNMNTELSYSQKQRCIGYLFRKMRIERVSYHK